MYVNFTFNKFSLYTSYFNIYGFIDGLTRGIINATKNQIWILIFKFKYIGWD